MPRASSRMPCLPAGFRFHPTDEELIVHYLRNQAASIPCPVPIIAEVNIYQCNPWDLPPKALFGEKEWFFFSPRDRKYPNGARPNRAAGSGYWKATGTDKAIVSTPTSENIGVKKALVFYRGKPPRGVKTDWIMHEYRLTTTTKRSSSSSSRGSSSTSFSMRLDDWVLCRIHKKSNSNFFSDQDQEVQEQELEQEEGSTSTVEEPEGPSSLNNNNNNNNNNNLMNNLSPKSEKETEYDLSMTKSCSLTDLLSTIDYSTLSQLLLDAPPPPGIDEIYATPACHDEPLTTSVNPNKSSSINMPPQDGALYSEYGTSYDSSLKRKRVMTSDDNDAFSFDGGSSLKKQLQLPIDSRRSSTFFVGSSSTSGYCNQQQIAEASSSSSNSFIQYSSSLLNHHPFPNQQQLLPY